MTNRKYSTAISAPDGSSASAVSLGIGYACSRCTVQYYRQHVSIPQRQQWLHSSIVSTSVSFSVSSGCRVLSSARQHPSASAVAAQYYRQRVSIYKRQQRPHSTIVSTSPSLSVSSSCTILSSARQHPLASAAAAQLSTIVSTSAFLRVSSGHTALTLAVFPDVRCVQHYCRQHAVLPNKGAPPIGRLRNAKTGA